MKTTEQHYTEQVAFDQFLDRVVDRLQRLFDTGSRADLRTAVLDIYLRGKHDARHEVKP